MIMKICSIHDAKAEAWLTPMFFQAAGQAMRSFEDAINNKESEFGKHPEDYSLFLLASFDPRTGEILLMDKPVSLALGINLVSQSDDMLSHRGAFADG